MKKLFQMTLILSGLIASTPSFALQFEMEVCNRLDGNDKIYAKLLKTRATTVVAYSGTWKTQWSGHLEVAAGQCKNFSYGVTLKYHGVKLKYKYKEAYFYTESGTSCNSSDSRVSIKCTQK